MKTMVSRKRIAGAIAAVLLVTCPGLALCGQAEDIGMWTAIFDESTTVDEQLAYIRYVSSEGYQGTETEDFYLKALKRLLVEYVAKKTSAERSLSNEAVRIVAARLGELAPGSENSSEVARTLWQAVEFFPDPLVKTSALIALGQIKDEAYFDEIRFLLRNQNTRPITTITQLQNASHITYGALVALEYYGNPDAYIEVLEASALWTTPDLKDQIQRTLKAIIEDPTEPILGMIPSVAYSMPLKYLALQAEEASSAPDASKAKAAVAALAEGWRVVVSGAKDREAQVALRKLALTMIEKYQPTEDDDRIYTLLNRSYSRGSDINEKLGAVHALAALKTDEAVKRLSSYLGDYYDAYKLGKSLKDSTDLRLVRAMILALGDIGSTGSATSRPVLVKFQQSALWTPAVRNLASDALSAVVGT